MDLMDYRREIIGNSPHLMSASGAVVTFADGTDLPLKSLNVDIEPVQDLHGYDSPWIGGGGKNLCPPLVDNELTSNGLTLTPNSDGTVRVHGTATNTSAVLLRMKTVSITLSAGTYTFGIGVYPTNNKVYAQCVYSGGTLYTRVAPKTITFNDAVTITRIDIGVNAASGDNIDITLYPQLELGSTATAYAPYENICPISGWNDINIYDDPIYPGTINWNQKISNREVWPAGGSLAWNNNEVEFTVTELVDAAWKSRISFLGDYGFYLTANDKFIISFDVKPAHTRTMGVYIMVKQGSGANKYIATQTLTAGQWNHVDIVNSVSADVDTAYLQISVGAMASNGYAVGDKDLFRNVECFNITQMFGANHEPSTILEFRALFPNDYYSYNEGEKTLVSAVNGMPYIHATIDLGQTVYGGTLNPLTGVLTVDRIVEHPTSVTGSQIGTYGRCYIYTTGSVALRKQTDALAMCDMLASTLATTATFAVNQYGGANAIYFISLDSTYDTIAKYNAWLAENKPTIVLWLATPYEIQLTPHQIRTLYGNNTIYADTGDIALEYWAHP